MFSEIGRESRRAADPRPRRILRRVDRAIRAPGLRKRTLFRRLRDLMQTSATTTVERHLNITRSIFVRASVETRADKLHQRRLTRFVRTKKYV